jgi:hypothetical protein
MGGFLLFEQLFKDRQNPAPEKNRPLDFMNRDDGCNEWVVDLNACTLIAETRLPQGSCS